MYYGNVYEVPIGGKLQKQRSKQSHLHLLAVLLPAQPTPWHKQAQPQVLRVTQDYLAREPRHPPGHPRRHEGGDAHVPPPPIIEGIPIRRVRGKQSVPQAARMPPRPHQGEWRLSQHLGVCVREHGQWKALCHRCGRSRVWRRWHEMPQCEGARKGQRVAPSPTFSKIYQGAKAFVQCSRCMATSVWIRKKRFERGHRCQENQDGEPIIHHSREQKLAREEADGYVRHDVMESEGAWHCCRCAQRVKRKQSLLQTWCTWPPHGSRYMFRG